MSAPYAAIRSALTARLQTLSGLPSVAWENVPFTPTAGSMYLKPSFLPGEPVQAEIGTYGQNMHTGLYQISVFAPAGTGVASLNTLRDALCDHFKRGTELIYSGVTVRLIKAFPSPMMQETDWVHIPITVMWRAYADN